MTLLVAVKFKYGVIFTADTMNTAVNITGEPTGEKNTVSKVEFIKENIIVSIGGLTPLGPNVINIVKAKLSNQPNIISFQKALKCIEQTMKEQFSLFVRDNPNFPDPELFMFVGGYDPESKTAYIYALSHINNFRPVEQPYYTAIGPEEEKAIAYIKDNLQGIRDMNKVVEVLAESIRLVNHETVSKDTLSLTSFYIEEHNKVYRRKIEIDRFGESKQTNL
ncbi:hypothetical protein IUK39_03750 [Priestia aryabhattai]|uniref:hypothetical protein n=1 Tax=Priestia aryabhattai TaxID=412384 RepID=UPI001C0CFD51|nr:hypothetical protein [Priestia aryabhattai]MBU3569292.1 hypothetical protein [Priestia aryabhattai]